MTYAMPLEVLEDSLQFIAAHRCFSAGFAHYPVRQASLDRGYQGHDTITEKFYALMRPAILEVRAYLRFPPRVVLPRLESLLSRRGKQIFLDHQCDDAFDSRFLWSETRETGYIFVHSVDAALLKLPALFAHVWSPIPFTNPRSAIGSSAARYGKSCEGNAVRVCTMRHGFDDPSVLFYADEPMISTLFKHAVATGNFYSGHIDYFNENYPTNASPSGDA